MDLDFDIDCPECGSTLRVTMAEVARGATKRCQRGHSVTLVDDGGGARKAEKAMSDLQRQIDRLGR